MGKIEKYNPVGAQAHWEGGEAATVGRGRSTNPYPHSDTASRDAWFAGYDEALTRLARQVYKRR